MKADRLHFKRNGVKMGEHLTLIAILNGSWLNLGCFSREDAYRGISEITKGELDKTNEVIENIVYTIDRQHLNSHGDPFSLSITSLASKFVFP